MPTTQAPSMPVSAASARPSPSSLETSQRLARARVLMVGLEPWGAMAALDLASAGVGALHLLDDAAIRQDDVGARRPFTDADQGKLRGAALADALSRIAPACQVGTGAIVAAADRPLALEDTRWDLVLACVPGDDLFVLHSVARFAHAARIPSLSAYLDGVDAIIGPGVFPGQTACFACARKRWLATREKPAVEAALEAALLSARPAPRARMYLAPMPATLGHSLALAALDLLLSPEAAPSRGHLLVQNLVSLEASRHAVLPMPFCDLCGGARAQGNGYRSMQAPAINLSAAQSPSELRRMLAGIVDERTGIVKRLLVGPTDPSMGIEMARLGTAVLSEYATWHCPDHPHEPEVGSGKGLTLVEAMISAVGEAVERYSGAQIDESRILRAPAAAMKDDHMAPHLIGLYSDEQYARPGFPYSRPTPNTPIDWVKGYWLDTDAPVYVPVLVTYYDYHPHHEEHFCQVTSNGLAAGPTIEDAALRALLELVERDTYMLTWLARRPGRRVRLDDSLDAQTLEVVRQMALGGARLELYLLDVGVPVPTMMCVAFGDGKRWPGAMVSLAAHLSPRVAMKKAIMEQVQGGPYIRRWMEEGKKTIPARPEDVRVLDDHALYYVPPSRASAFEFLDAGGTVRAADLQEPQDRSLAELVRRISAAGLRAAVVDVTSPDLWPTPFRVARAFGPDFLQIHFGHELTFLGNPRLVAMAPDGINPDPHPMA